MNNIIDNEDEQLNEELKDAGLYEEGLSREDKEILLNCIRASRSTAKQEEQKRKSIDHENIKEAIDISGDSDSEIHMQSPNEQCQKSPKSPSLSYQIREKSRALNQGSVNSPLDSSSFRVANTSQSHVVSPVIKRSQVPPRSIVCKQRKKELREETVIYASDASGDETQIDQENLSSKENSQECKETSGNSKTVAVANIHEPNDSNDIFFISPNVDTEKTHDKDDVHPINQLNMQALGKALKKSSPPLEKQPCIKTDKNTYSKLSEEKENLEVEHKLKELRVHDQTFSFDIESTNFSIPLQRKNLKSEKSNRCFFKSSYETKSQCVQRICSMFTEYHSNLLAYQSTLSNFVRWGPPITVCRNSNSMVLRKTGRTVTYNTFDISDSDERVSSDDDFEFPVKTKGRVKKYKNTRVYKPKQVINYTVHSKTETESKAVVPETNDFEDDSPNTLPDIPDVSESIATSSFYANKKTRKTFELHPSSQSSQNLKAKNTDDDEDNLFVRVNRVSANVHDTKETSVSNNKDPLEITGEDDFTEVKTSSNSYDTGFISVRGDKRKAVLKNTAKNRKKMRPENTQTIEDCEEFEIRPSPLKCRKRNGLREKDGQCSTSNIGHSKDTGEDDMLEVSHIDTEHSKVPETGITTEIEHPLKSVEESELETVPEVSEMAQDQPSIQCPLCQRMFPLTSIEVHASDCDGSIEDYDRRSNLRARIQTSAQDVDQDIVVIGSRGSRTDK